MYNNVSFLDAPMMMGKSDYEYLPKWAMEEQIFNCENRWKELGKDFMIKSLFSFLF